MNTTVNNEYYALQVVGNIFYCPLMNYLQWLQILPKDRICPLDELIRPIVFVFTQILVRQD